MKKTLLFLILLGIGGATQAHRSQPATYPLRPVAGLWLMEASLPQADIRVAMVENSGMAENQGQKNPFQVSMEEKDARYVLSESNEYSVSTLIRADTVGQKVDEVREIKRYAILGLMGCLPLLVYCMIFLRRQFPIVYQPTRKLQR